MDVNDNYPEFADIYRPVIYENYPAGRSIIEISATDRDTLTNGPPFEFWLPCNGNCPCHANPTCHEFSFRFIPGGGDNGFGSGVVTSLKTFDREQRKEYYIPVIMKDGGSPSISGTNTLTITIGDINDNKHYPGHKNIYVYSYRGWKGIFEDIPLGNVYAEDADDWDVSNKSFAFSSRGDDDSALFRLDQETGELSTNGQLHEGEFNFQVKVYDIVWKREVVSTVTVFVKEVGDEAIANSGSLRLKGIAAEEFIMRIKTGSRADDYHKSRYDLLRERLAQKMSVSAQNVDIFSVANHHSSTRTIDVRYSVHGSLFYRPTKVDGLVLTYREEFEDLLGVKLAMSPINECLTERCESGGCSSILVSTGHPILINTNSTSYVGVMTYVQIECVCAAMTFTDNNQDVECQPASCLNGGTCHQRDYGFTCECLPGFDGPRCQQTRHSFRGNGWAWFKPLAQCDHSHLSFELLTTKEAGLILYHGPMKDLVFGEVEDFFLLELRYGYPFLRVNFGSGETKVTIDGRDRSGQLKLAKLNDGLWHRVDVFMDGKQIRLVVDRCEVGSSSEFGHGQVLAEDRRACEALSEVPGDRQLVNINAPLQVGGRSNHGVKYPPNVLLEGFYGCVKNLFVNGELYDLHIGQVGESRNADDGCAREDAACRTKDRLLGPKCGVNGTCIGSFHSAMRCVCRPGFRGPHCSIATTVKDFHQHSFIEWDFQDRFFERLTKQLHRTDIQLMFRTRRDSGLLFKTQNVQKSEYMLIEVSGCKISFRYGFGSAEHHLTLSYVNVSDGVWHTVFTERVGQWAVLKLDSGEGRFFNESLGRPGGQREIRVSQRSIFSGGDVRFPSSSAPPLVDHDFENGCMNDVRFNGEWLPMEYSQNRESRAADYQPRSQNIQTGCPSDMCRSDRGPVCLYGTVCIDTWRHAECRCPRGRRLVTQGSYDLCENINECLEYPSACLHGNCHDTEDGYYCHCFHGYTGPDCSIRTEMAAAFISTSAMLTIIVCAVCVLVLLVILVVVSRRRQAELYSAVGNPDEDVRENIIHYNEEGVGEEDQNAYDINKLRKPLQDAFACVPSSPTNNQISDMESREAYPPAPECEALDNFINNRLREIDDDPNAPPYDTVREYAYEGSATSTRSLSSIESVTPGGKDKNDETLPHCLQNNCKTCKRPGTSARTRNEMINESSITTEI